MQFLHSKTWRLAWADPSQVMPQKPVTDPETGETVMVGVPDPYALAQDIMKPRLREGESIRQVFTAGEELFLFTESRMVSVERAEASLTRTVASLPYRRIASLETVEPVEAGTAALPALRLTCGYGFEGELLFMDADGGFTPELLRELEKLITDQMLES